VVRHSRSIFVRSSLPVLGAILLYNTCQSCRIPNCCYEQQNLTISSVWVAHLFSQLFAPGGFGSSRPQTGNQLPFAGRLVCGWGDDLPFQFNADVFSFFAVVSGCLRHGAFLKTFWQISGNYFKPCWLSAITMALSRPWDRSKVTVVYLSNDERRL
jgi:hypothetical protein